MSAARTPGEWFVGETFDNDGTPEIVIRAPAPGGETYAIAVALGGLMGQESNAELLAEAGAVAHESGLTPHQLVARITTLEAQSAELLAALQGARLIIRCQRESMRDEYTDPKTGKIKDVIVSVMAKRLDDCLVQADAAIANATGSAS